MTNRNRRGFARIGMLAIALLLALGAMGVAYSAWTDDIYIEGTFSTGDINAGLQCSTCWEEADGAVTDVPGTDIDCTGGSMTLNIDVTNALEVTNPTSPEDVDYYCSFIVSNAAGSLPIKIASMNLTGSYTGVTAVFDDLTGTVLDPGPGPGSTATGQVHIHLTSAASVGQNLTFVLTATVSRWND